tara:strand:- start:231 stop:803 length:573 start_codon:yes stop_codon:yes gene_type:complete
MQGYQEVPLNDRGIRQADLLARRFMDEGIDQIVCSDLRRAVMTGCIVAARTGASMAYDVGLRERDPGELVESSYDAAPEFFTDESFVPVGGEAMAEFRARVRETFTRIGECYENQCKNLAVVSHGMVCQAFVSEFFGATASEGVGAGNATVSIANVDHGRWALEEATCGAHLVEEASYPLTRTGSEATGA